MKDDGQKKKVREGRNSVRNRRRKRKTKSVVGKKARTEKIRKGRKRKTRRVKLEGS